ncbi:MAG: glycosyltransferase [Bacillota bacterium]|nr:glycosyltransferase [Bacillota bacterium]
MKIKLRGPVEDATGYAKVTREIALALHRLGVDVCLQPVAWGATRADLPLKTKKLLESFTAGKNTGCCLLNIGIPPFFIRDGCPTIGLTMLEVDGISRSWASFCNRMDEVWVPSQFNKLTFAKSGVDERKIKVMPLGVDINRFTPSGPKLPFPEARPLSFKFLSVFEWVPRKGPDILLKAFLQEFSAQDDVCLILKCHSNGTDYDPDGKAIKEAIQKATSQYWRDASKAPAIILLSRTLPDVQMPALYRAADCFVLPTRGEGWNIPALEALVSGLPVITTDWSAHLDWLNEDNAFLIDVEALEPVPCFGTPNDFVYGGFRWARPSLVHLRHLMRWVYEHREAARLKALKARKAIELSLSWEASAKRMIERLQELTILSRPKISAPTAEIGEARKNLKEMHAMRGEPETDLSLQVGMVIPSWNAPCGIAAYTRSLCQALKKLGCDVKILGSHLSRLHLEDLGGASIIHFQYEYSLYNNDDMKSFYREVVDRGIYPLLTLHSYTDQAQAHNLLLQQLFPKIIVHAEHTRDILKSRGWRQEIRVIPMGVPEVALNGQKEIKKELGIGVGPAVGFFGFMHWHKGIIFLVQAVKKLSIFYPGAQCYIFSSVNNTGVSEQFYKYFLDQIRVLGLADVVKLKLGFLPEEKLVHYLSAMDINVLPYTDCGFNSTSAAVRLLIAARRPVITSEIPFFGDLTDQVVKISEVTPEAIFDALVWLLDQPAVQQEMVERLDRYAHENTWEASALQHYLLYQELLTQKKEALTT